MHSKKLQKFLWSASVFRHFCAVTTHATHVSSMSDLWPKRKNVGPYRLFQAFASTPSSASSLCAGLHLQQSSSCHSDTEARQNSGFQDRESTCVCKFPTVRTGHLKKCFSRIQPVHFNQEEFCRDLNILQNVEAEIAPFFHLETAINLQKNHTSQKSFKIIKKVLNPTGALADCMAFSRVAFLKSWGSISRRKGRACPSTPAIPNLFSPWLHTDEHVRDIHVSCALACRRRSAVMFSIVHRPSSAFTPKQTPNKWEYSSEVVHKTGDQHQDLLELSASILFLRRTLWEPLLETSSLSLSLWLIRAQMVRQGL